MCICAATCGENSGIQGDFDANEELIFEQIIY